MKENRYCTDKKLNRLLQKLILEETDHANINKSMTMTANYVFDGTPGISMSIEKEKEMLKKLNKTFVPASGNSGFWKMFLSGLIVLMTGVYFWSTRTGTSEQIDSPETKIQYPVVIEKEENGQAVEQKDEPRSEQKIAPVSEQKETVKDSSFSQEIIVEKIDSSAKDEIISGDMNRNKSYNNPPENSSFVPKYFPEKELFHAPSPVFNAKPFPENYRVLKGSFIIDSLSKKNYSYFIAQDSFTSYYYEGEPFKKGTLPDMQYFNYGHYVQELADDKWYLPTSILLYANKDKIEIRETESAQSFRKNLVLNEIPKVGIDLMVNPFYFKKFEVTNREYREFLEWVKISNGYGGQKIQQITTDTIAVNDPDDNWGEQITIKGRKYRLTRKTVPLENFEKVFAYSFFNKDHEFTAHLNSAGLYVLPDTTCWTADFPNAFNQPMTNFYFWHPAYDDYPVVGVNWYQAMAFLDWKTKMHQEQLDAQNIPFEVFYSLPSEIHWELISMTAARDKKLIFQASSQDINWVSDLGVGLGNKNQNDEHNQRLAYLKNLFTKEQYTRGNFMTDGFFHTGPADLTKQKLQANQAENLLIGPFDISWLGGNVSEWMRENYQNNWQPYFKLHQKTFPENNEELQLAARIEAFFNETNAKNGRLVRGANWYDERFGQKAGSVINDAGMSPKRFLDPSVQHSTVGFRYVLLVSRKD